MTTTVGLLTFEHLDLMDLAGPYEVLLTANRLRERGGGTAPFQLLTIGPPRVATYGGLRIEADLRPADAPDLDLLIVSGAVDLSAVDVAADLAELAPRTGVVASVCTGAFLLQRAGLLEGVPATTHWEDVTGLQALGVDATDGVRWVDAGTVVTGGGLSSGIAMALHLVERFTDRALAQAVATQIDYVWTEAR